MATFLNTTVLSADILAHPPIAQGSGFRKITNLNPATFAAADKLDIEPGGTAVFELSAKGKNANSEDVLIFLDKLGAIGGEPTAQVLFDSTTVDTTKKHHDGKRFTYELVTPDGTLTRHKHRHPFRPATFTYTFQGATTITTNFSGVDVYVATAHAQHSSSGGTNKVKYTLGDPAAAGGTKVAAGLSGDGIAVGPEHVRRRAVGII